jgi:hypothetical protein
MKKLVAQDLSNGSCHNIASQNGFAWRCAPSRRGAVAAKHALPYGPASVAGTSAHYSAYASTSMLSLEKPAGFVAIESASSSSRRQNTTLETAIGSACASETDNDVETPAPGFHSISGTDGEFPSANVQNIYFGGPPFSRRTQRLQFRIDVDDMHTTSLSVHRGTSS